MADIRESKGLAGDGQTARVDPQTTSLGRLHAMAAAEKVAAAAEQKTVEQAAKEDVPAYVIEWRKAGMPTAKRLADGSVGYYDARYCGYRCFVNLPASAGKYLGL